jgi:cell filamentation protein
MMKNKLYHAATPYVIWMALFVVAPIIMVVLYAFSSAEGGFTFANCMHFPATLEMIERMPETTFDEILDKYVEMNVAHPFMEGNGRSTRIWFDLMLKHSLKLCVDWSKIDKNEYLSSMRESVSDSTHLKTLVKSALTNQIDDREMFMKGIDYSYYYEQTE